MCSNSNSSGSNNNNNIINSPSRRRNDDDSATASSSISIRLLVWSFPLFFILVLSKVTHILSQGGGPIDAPPVSDDFQSAFPEEFYNHDKDPNAPCTPRKLHLSQASNVVQQDENYAVVNYTFSFTVPSANPKCRTAKPYLIYGTDGSSSIEGVVTESEVVHFHYVSTPNNREEYSSDWIHHMIIPNLKAGRVQYWYRLFLVDRPTETKSMAIHRSLLAASLDDSPITSLRGKNPIVLGETPNLNTLQTAPNYHQPTTLALVGDLGQTENSTKTMHHIYQATKNNTHGMAPVSALLIAGDMSYADGDPHRWESWFDLMEPLLRSTPIQVAAGNHEIECDNRTSDIFVPYESYFRNPNRIHDAEMSPVPDDYRKTLWHEQCTTSSEFVGRYDYGNSFYSFTHGLAHVIVLNSYTDTLPNSPQYQWLDEELSERVDRQKTPWLLVMFHCPLHTTFIGHNGELNPFLMLQSMEPLFVEYNVNLVLSGHDHAYMRTTPMVGETAADTGPIYLTLGAGGNREQHSKGYIHDVPEEWVVKRDNQEYGYGHLFLANQTHALFHWVRDGTTDKGIQDTVWIENQLFRTAM